MLERLKKEASEEEIEEANYALQNLESEFLDWLPDKLLQDKRTLGLLTSLQLVEGSPLHEWKTGVDEVLEEQQMPEMEAMAEVADLTLLSRIHQMLEP